MSGGAQGLRERGDPFVSQFVVGVSFSAACWEDHLMQGRMALTEQELPVLLERVSQGDGHFVLDAL